MPPPQQQPPHKRRHIRKAIALVPCIQRAQQASGTCEGFWTIAAPCQTKASSCGNTFGRQTSLTDLHSAALWQHLFTANKLILQTAPNGFFCRRNTARIYSAASWQPLCQTQQSAAPLQSSISRRRPYKTKSPHSTHCKGDPTLACKTTRSKHCYPVRRGASVCAPPLWYKKRTCNGCRFSFYKSILAGIFDSRLYNHIRLRVGRKIKQNTIFISKNTTFCSNTAKTLHFRNIIIYQVISH